LHLTALSSDPITRFRFSDSLAYQDFAGHRVCRGKRKDMHCAAAVNVALSGKSGKTCIAPRKRKTRKDMHCAAEAENAERHALRRGGERCPSALSNLNFRVKPLQFDAGLLNSELPVDGALLVSALSNHTPRAGAPPPRTVSAHPARSPRTGSYTRASVIAPHPGLSQPLVGAARRVHFSGAGSGCHGRVCDPRGRSLNSTSSDGPRRA
jgi:hypothetical protein